MIFSHIRSARILSIVGIFGTLLAGPRVHSPRSPERLVAEAPIWGPKDAKDGRAFLRVTMYGHVVTVVVNFTEDRDLTIATAPLARLGITPFQTTRLDSLRIGPAWYTDIPLNVIDDPDWTQTAPAGLPPVVGVMSGRFLAAHYDLVYDFPGRRVQLYRASPAVGPRARPWLPPKFTATDCARLRPVPPIAGAFTGMAATLDGTPVTGVLEMIPYGGETYHDEKMNGAAFAALKLPATSPRVGPMRDAPGMFNGALAKDEVGGVHVRVGGRTLFTGPVKVFPNLEVDDGLPPNTPVVLLNLMTIRHLVLFNSASSGRVCLRAP